MEDEAEYIEANIFFVSNALLINRSFYLAMKRHDFIPSLFFTNIGNCISLHIINCKPAYEPRFYSGAQHMLNNFF